MAQMSVKVVPDLTALRRLLRAVDTLEALEASHVDNGYGWCQGCGSAEGTTAAAFRHPCPTSKLIAIEDVA